MLHLLSLLVLAGWMGWLGWVSINTMTVRQRMTAIVLMSGVSLLGLFANEPGACFAAMGFLLGGGAYGVCHYGQKGVI